MKSVTIAIPNREFKELYSIIDQDKRNSDEWLDREGIKNIVIYVGTRRDKRIVFTIKNAD